MEMPRCMNCQRPHEEHVREDGRCPDGKNTFNCEFQISDEAFRFVSENLDKSSDELARLWIDRVRGRTRP